MECVRQRRHIAWLLATFVLLTLALAGCESQTGPSAQGANLRITNNGPALARTLTVLFPESQVGFGDVPAGTTTAYRNAPNGVFRYAAYRLEVDGDIVTQPVIDWVGERPMEGRAFTYTIDVDPRRARGEIVRLISVTRDE